MLLVLGLSSSQALPCLTSRILTSISAHSLQLPATSTVSWPCKPLVHLADHGCPLHSTRQRNVSEASETDTGSTVAKGRADTAELARATPQLSYSASDICNYFGDESSTPHHYHTLHSSKASPDTLAFVLLFHGANPRWPTDNIIYVKSNLDLLESDTATTKENMAKEPSTTPVAMFEQIRRGARRNFEFRGWYKIARLEFVDKSTPEKLVRMLEQKWQRKDRRGNVTQIERDSVRSLEGTLLSYLLCTYAQLCFHMWRYDRIFVHADTTDYKEQSAWKSSFSMRWAVIKFEKDGERKDIPDIEILPNSENREQKSVNELLQEMRLKDAAKSEAQVTKSNDKENDAPLAEQDGNVQRRQTSPTKNTPSRG
jgi:hypothetical protein